MNTIFVAKIRKYRANGVDEQTQGFCTIERASAFFKHELTKWLQVHGHNWDEEARNSRLPTLAMVDIHNIENKLVYIRIWKRESTVLQIQKENSAELELEMCLHEITLV